MSSIKAIHSPGLGALLFDRLSALGPRMISYFALVFYLISFGLIGYLFFSNIPEEKKFYSDNLVKSRESKDPRKVDLCLDALLSLEPDNFSIRYEYARFLESKKQFSDARTILEGITSLEDDTPSHDEAQWLVGKRLWLARGADEAQTAIALNHLKKAVELSPKNETFHIDYGTALYELGRLPEALPHIAIGVKVRPELAVSLAEKLVVRDRKIALDLLQLAEGPIQAKMKAEPTNEYYLRSYALIQGIRGKLPETINILQSAYANNRSSELLKKDLAMAIANQIILMLQSTPVDLQQILPLLDKGLEVDPKSDVLYGVMGRIMAMNTQGKLKVKEKLSQLLTKGGSIDLVHYLLGIDAHMSSRPDLARLHFELAFRANPKIPELMSNYSWFMVEGFKSDLPNIYNNLAWYMANEPPRDPQRGLSMVNQAIQFQPNNPSFYETRGQIYVMFSQWKNAITDLELALSAMGSTPGIHKSLALCYEKLGMKDEAQAHQAKADKFKEVPNVPTGPRKRT